MLTNPGKSRPRQEKEVVFQLVDDNDEATQPPSSHGPGLPTPEQGRRRRPEQRAATAHSTSGAPLGFGIASLLVGASQFVFCALTPFSGLLVFPAAVIGLLLGFVGLAISLRGKTRENAFPIAGLAVNAIALGMVLFWYVVLASKVGNLHGEQPAEVVARRTQTELAPEPERKPAARDLQPAPKPEPEVDNPPEIKRPPKESSLESSRAGLRSADAAERRAAAAKLRDLGGAAADAVPDLTAAVKDPDAAVREAAIDALRKLGRPGATAYVDVVRATDDESPAVRQAAERYLQNFGPPPAAATNALAALATDDKLSSDIQLRALTLFTEAAPDSPALLAVCLKAAVSKSASVRARALRCLGQPGRVHDRAVLKALLMALGDPAKSVRDAATAAIERAGSLDASDVPALLEGLKGDSATVRVFALVQLTQIGRGAREALSDVSEALRDADPAVRRAAMDCLLVIAPDRSGDVANFLTDRDKEIRAGAIAALRRRLQPAACFEILADALAVADETARKEIAVALDRDEMRLVNDVPARTKIRLSTALTDANAVVRLKAAKALQRMGWGSERLARVLAELLREDSESVSREAADTLKRMGESARLAANDLLRALRSPDAQTRQSAAAALRSAGSLKPEAISTLIAALADGAIHDNVAILLADFGESAVGDLVRALESHDVETRRGAAKALGLIGPKAADAYKPLTQLFRNDQDATARNEASKAMESIRRRQ
jgi:HEAT repeat protein